jgi:hypothetical protein
MRPHPLQVSQTYQITSPLATHFRKGTCEEADCEAYQHGFRFRVDERTDLGQGQAHFFRKESGRRFVEERDDAGMTVFTFEPGQQCFQTHQVPLERPAAFLVRAGDIQHRGGVLRRHTSGDSFMDDLHTTTDHVITAQQRG